MNPTTKTKLHIGTDYGISIYPQKYAITVEPMENHVHYETKGNVLGYRYLVKNDVPVWKN